MKIITTREMRQEAKSYFELAEKERVAVKRGKKYVNLIVSDSPDSIFVDDKWIAEFMRIPEKFRCNPFEYSPSGDLFYADIRNVNKISTAIQEAENDKKRKHTYEIGEKEGLDEVLNY